LGHREDFHGWEKFGGQVRESAGVEAAWADFGEERGTEHFSAIDEIDWSGDMARVTMFGLNCLENRSLLGGQNDRNFASGCVVGR
jgi:hypothetical protein